MNATTYAVLAVIASLRATAKITLTVTANGSPGVTGGHVGFGELKAACCNIKPQDITAALLKLRRWGYIDCNTHTGYTLHAGAVGALAAYVGQVTLTEGA